MKKVLAIALALTMLLSINALAFAAPSPTGGASSANVPVSYYDVPTGGEALVIRRHILPDGTESTTLTPEQEKQVDLALENATKEGYLPVDAIYVEVPEGTSETNPIEVIIELKEGEVLLVYSLDGELLHAYTRDDLTKVGDDEFEVSLPESCILVIARQ